MLNIWSLGLERCYRKKKLCEKERKQPNRKTMCFTMTDNRRTRSVSAAEGNKFSTMNELRVELLHLGREVVDIRAVPEQEMHESEEI